MTIRNFYVCGFRKVAAVVPKVAVGDVDSNVNNIIRCIESEELKNSSLIVFPELSVTGYTCADLFLQDTLLKAAKDGIGEICMHSLHWPEKMIVVGAPIIHRNKLYNCAVFINDGRVIAYIPKTHIPNYGEYYEKRWFESALGLENTTIDGEDVSVPFGTNIIVRHQGMRIGAEICEDLWVPVPPSSYLAIKGADVIVNLSASNESLGKSRYRRALILQQSARCRAAYLYASAGAGESSTDLAFAGYAAVADAGTMAAESPTFSSRSYSCDAIDHLAVGDIDILHIKEDRKRYGTFGDLQNNLPQPLLLHSDNYPLDWYTNENDEIRPKTPEINRMPFVPSDPAHRSENCTEIINIQCHGLLQRLSAIHCHKIVIGVSGGLDSTLALLIAVRTLKMAGADPSDVIAITMPGEATTSRTRNNAMDLMQRLGCTCLEIPIGAAVAQHFKDIDQDPNKYDATYENSQARERTQILMDYANKTGGIVLGTGDLSELALGWCTYNGDHMSMYAVNASVPKTLVKYLVEWFAYDTTDAEIRRILLDICDTPISPELVPAAKKGEEIEQKTEDLVGPYILHDFFIYHTLRNGFNPVKIYRLACEAFKKEFDKETILKWERSFYRRFFSQQFKRSCMPDGPKVGSVCLSPRGDWRMPSDASSRQWLKMLDNIDAKDEKYFDCF